MNLVLPLRIEACILSLRGQRVVLDTDLAELYGVPTKRLNEQVKRNASRFPVDFMFQLNAAEKAEVVANCDHLSKLKFSKSMPYAFTEHGAIQAANVLASPQAIEMGIYVVRAFVQLRQAAITYTDLAQRLTDLELKVEGLEIKSDNFAHNTRTQLRQIFEALHALTQPPDPPKRAIGFILPPDAPASDQ
ncbi:MAG: ORF6N domain-containing protein [Comamonadaceae bacterium]|nr:ORF6N domain-containing protein [Comamonadaceae bacterium]